MKPKQQPTLNQPPSEVVFLSPSAGDTDQQFEQLAQILATIAERVAMQDNSHDHLAETLCIV